MPSRDADIVLAAVRSVVSDLRGSAARSVHLDSDLRADLGLDSLAMVEVFDRIGEQAGVTLGEDVLATAKSPLDLVLALRDARVDHAGRESGTARLETGSHDAGIEVGVPPSRITPDGEPAPASLPEAGAFSTLYDALAWHSAVHANRVHVRLLGSNAEEALDELTYGRLLKEARAVASALIEEGLSPGERVALMLGTESAFFSVFLGIGLAGGVPVPLYPPARREALAEQLTQLAGVLRNAGAAVLVTLPEAVNAARLVMLQVPSLRAVRTPRELEARAAGPVPLPRIAAEATALIQYTSGSTGDPKGVVLTHLQLLANIDAMAQGAAATPDDVVVSWLPLYHDMGLIGMWLAPLVLGFPLVVMSPLAFLARPVRWLEAISTYKGTITAAPNVAFKSCTERIRDDELEGIDLSSWRLAFNGSEPVSAAVIEGFIERFGPFGFEPRAMCPAYGLAEAGVGIAFSPLGRGPRVDTISRFALARSGRAVVAPEGGPDAEAVVGCGYPLAGYEFRVADDAGRDLEERTEGRVFCRGPSLTAAYFGEEAGKSALWQRGWLDTGDLGYVADGELFLTGRTKDLIIRGGRNVHPEDVEAAIRDVEGLEEGSVAAFAVPDPTLGTERVVVVAETRLSSDARRAALEHEIRQRTARVLGAAPDVVELAWPGSIRRTPSRKVRRGATRDAFLTGTLQRPARPVALELAEFVRSEARPATRRAARLASNWVFAGRAWVGVLVVAAPVAALVSLPLSVATRWRLIRWGLRAVLAMTGVRVHVQGALPDRETPAVVVANHPSFVDAAALVFSSAEPLTFVTSTDFERKAVIGPFLRRIGCAFIERGEPARIGDELAALAMLVRGGSRLVVFPEGSISPSPGVRSLHLGAFAVAATTGSRIVPVALVGTREVLRAGSFFPRRHEVSVFVGDAVDPPAPHFADEAAAAEKVRGTLAAMAGEAPTEAP